MTDVCLGHISGLEIVSEHFICGCISLRESVIHKILSYFPRTAQCLVFKIDFCLTHTSETVRGSWMTSYGYKELRVSVVPKNQVISSFI